MNLTPTGREALDRYIASVRRSVGSRADVDVRDVEAGILEHVEAELAVRSIELATSEDISDVLDGLGPPAAFDEGRGVAENEASQTRMGPAASMAAALLVAGLAVVGAGLVGSNMPVPGWLALSLAIVLARVLISSGADHRPEILALVIFWQVAVAAAAAVLLLAPAALVWAAAQIGGVLERPLAAATEVTGAGRPLRYWIATAQVAGAVTGIWWMLLGLLLLSLRQALPRMLGPARRLAPVRSAPVLLAAGGLLFILSLIGWLT
jgi:hypothetical protein